MNNEYSMYLKIEKLDEMSDTKKGKGFRFLF